MAADSLPFAMIVGLIGIGLVVGSFLGTLVLRLPEGRSVLFGRSTCDSCGTALKPWQLVPILSWLIQKRCCGSCGQRISWFYPGMEIAAAAVALWAAYTVSLSVLPLSLVLGWLLLTLAVMDLRSFRLSNVLTWPLLALGLAACWLIEPHLFVDHVLGVFAGAGSIGAVAIAYKHLRHRAGLGFGDVKLGAASGAWLGWQGLPSAVLVGAGTALLVVFVRRGLGHKIGWGSKVAFGGYFCFGTWIVWLYGSIVWGR